MARKGKKEKKGKRGKKNTQKTKKYLYDRIVSMLGFSVIVYAILVLAGIIFAIVFSILFG